MLFADAKTCIANPDSVIKIVISLFYGDRSILMQDNYNLIQIRRKGSIFKKIGGMKMADEAKGTTTWPDLAVGIWERLTGHHAEITYEFDHLEVFVPSAASSGAAHAKWIINGTVRIRSRELSE